MHNLLTSWDLERAGPTELARIADDLAAAGVEVEPPLAETLPDSMVELRLAREAPRPTRSRPRPTVPSNGAALAAVVLGGAGVLLVLGPKSIYGVSLAAGAVAIMLAILGRQKAGREAAVGGLTLSAVGAVLGAAALGIGVYGAVTLDEADDDAAPSQSAEAAQERERYCQSGDADSLTRITTAEIGSVDALRKATDEALDITEDAPGGAFCAVTALNALADSWNVMSAERDFEDAAEQVKRIRDFQREQELREPQF